ncbi:glycosyltransferase, partial [Methylobrevis pamukkalensis]|uniref:glycosyltransferase n=1 Tax=Methylobrevis pamukkalensis TaxID=1439726 RepID=UPI00114CDE83
VVLAEPAALRGLLRAAVAEAALAEAVGDLAALRPDLSARGVPSVAARSVIAAAVLALCAAAIFAPLVVLQAGLAASMAGFLVVGLLRLFAAGAVVWRRPRLAGTPDRLPVYTVLVALYDEAQMLPGLVAALERLRYPRDRLDVKIVLEAGDAATIAAALAATRGLDHVDVVVVPPGAPRTKPRALAHALKFARGSLVAVFDAEDRPAADQLLVAARAFAEGPAELGCVQARLVIDRVGNRLQAQFAIEYAALFDGLLPFLAANGLPLPLGGTSNHFRRSALENVGGWDPWNVTEDADLGVRLARFGWRSAMIDSVTLEEAPRDFHVWRRQRSRWIKGWLLTWIVHMRRPQTLWAEVGPLGFFAVQAYFGGIVVSALAHPAGMLLILLHASGRLPLAVGSHFLSDLVIAAATLNVAFGYGATMWLAARTLALRRRFTLGRQVIFMPVYWLLVSLAAWLAVFQLVARPHFWAKTPHTPHDGGRKRRTWRR